MASLHPSARFHMPGKCVHHVPEHPFTMSPVYTTRPRKGGGGASFAFEAPRIHMRLPCPSGGERARGRGTGSPPLREVAELLDELAVELALEGDDEVRQLAHLRPLPAAELGVVGGDVDVAVLALEAEGEPFLALAAKPSLPDLVGEIGRQI